MQLLPRTAASVHDEYHFRGENRQLLHDPVLNVALGQRYLRRLMNHQRVGSNLLRLAAAYNAGPGTLRKWDKVMGEGDDPLLFIESLPVLETRLFIERVFANFWVYRLGLGQPTPSLDALALDIWPKYQPLDGPAGIPGGFADSGGNGGQVESIP
jgi:soluble lytic murein transglycosylase-like protein